MTDDKAALLPCPFCGRTDVAQGASSDDISVWCFCGARGPSVPFPENCDPLPPILECHAKWNTRALLPAQRGEGGVDDVERAEQIERVAKAIIEYLHPGGSFILTATDGTAKEDADRFRGAAIYAIAALPRSTEGWQCVPREPTDKMIADAAVSVLRMDGTGRLRDVPASMLVAEAYRAMLAASPAAPAAGAERSGEDK